MVGRASKGSSSKKLTEATQALLGVAGEALAVDDDVRRQCASLGVDAAHFVASQAVDEPLPIDVWPEHHTAVQIFMRCNTQWVLQIGFGGAVYTGLNYTGVQVLIDAWGVRQRQLKELWDQLQYMEQIALPILNNRLNNS